MNRQYTLQELVKDLDVKVNGDIDCVITGVSTINDASAGHITFLTNNLYRKHLAKTKASAVILSEEDASECSVTAIVSNNPYYTYAKIAEFFVKQKLTKAGVHESVVLGESTVIDPTACIAAHCSIGARVKIAAKVVIGPGCIIGDDVDVQEGVVLDAGVTLYDGVRVGQRTHIASGAVIGSDGFGFANQKGAWHKVPQLGAVVIGDDVDIGSNTSIDRGAIDDTIIGNGVKLDNLIQIGHNVHIGDHSIMAGCTAVAGSAIIGKHCMIGGACMILGHIQICDNAIVTGGTGVSKSITEPGIYSSGIVGVVSNKEFRKNNARFHRLEGLMQRVKALEATIKELTERQE